MGGFGRTQCYDRRLGAAGSPVVYPQDHMGRVDHAGIDEVTRPLGSARQEGFLPRGLSFRKEDRQLQRAGMAVQGRRLCPGAGCGERELADHLQGRDRLNRLEPSREVSGDARDPSEIGEDDGVRGPAGVGRSRLRQNRLPVHPDPYAVR